jgi:glycosyltransferase involved in cell wall biosynthesis
MPVVLDARVVTGSGGGPDKTILNSPRFLSRDGYRMLCAYMHPPGDAGFEKLRAKARASHAPLVPVVDRGPWDWKVFSQLLDVCRRERVMIWHGHDYKSNAIGLALQPFWRMRLVTTVHGWVHQTAHTPLYYGIDRLCLKRYECVICVSDDLREECIDSGVSARRCLLVENGIDLAEYTRQRVVSLAKQELGIEPARLVIGAAGRLSAEKGFDLLIQAVDRLIRSGLDVELLIVGEGEQRPQLEALIEQLGQGDRIRLVGYQFDLRPYYEAMDLFALSSLREGLPNVVLEAMALEVPVVATRVAGIPRLIDHDLNGWLVPPTDLNRLTESLAQLLANPSRRARLAVAGRETVQARYSFEVRMRKIQAIYDELLSCGRH